MRLNWFQKAVLRLLYGKPAKGISINDIPGSVHTINPPNGWSDVPAI